MLWESKWIVYRKATARKAEQALDYLGRYTHRVAIADYRLLTLDRGMVTFLWRDRADKNTVKRLTLPVEQFIGRFLLHVLPHGLAKVRAFGWLAGRCKTATLAAIRATIRAKPPAYTPDDETPAARIFRLTGIDVRVCPCCKKGQLVYSNFLPPARDGPE